MGGILSGLTSGADVASLLGVAPGSNLGSYSTAATGVSMASTGSQLATQLTKESSWVHSFGKLGGEATTVLAAALTIVSRIFGGANPYNVPAAQTEQAFMGAMQLFKALHLNGYMTQAELLAAEHAMYTASQTYFQATIQKLQQEGASSYELKPFQNGMKHTAGQISGDYQYVASMPDMLPLKSWNQSAASALYGPVLRGYYGNSVQAAENLANGYMQNLRSGIQSPAASGSSKSKLAIGVLGAGVLALVHFW